MHQLILPFDADFVAQHMEYLLERAAVRRSWDKWDSIFKTEITGYQTGRYPALTQLIHDEFIVNLPRQLSLEFDQNVGKWQRLGDSPPWSGIEVRLPPIANVTLLPDYSTVKLPWTV